MSPGAKLALAVALVAVALGLMRVVVWIREANRQPDLPAEPPAEPEPVPDDDAELDAPIPPVRAIRPPVIRGAAQVDPSFADPEERTGHIDALGTWRRPIRDEDWDPHSPVYDHLAGNEPAPLDEGGDGTTGGASCVEPR